VLGVEVGERLRDGLDGPQVAEGAREHRAARAREPRGDGRAAHRHAAPRVHEGTARVERARHAQLVQHVGAQRGQLRRRPREDLGDVRESAAAHGLVEHAVLLLERRRHEVREAHGREKGAASAFSRPRVARNLTTAE